MSNIAIGNKGDTPPRDATTLAIPTIDYAHKEIHSGSHYSIADFATLADAAVLDFCVQAPDTTKWAHLLFSIQATQQTQIDVYEGTDADADGDLVVPINNNRNSLSTPGLIVRADCTINSVGTRISGQKFGVAGTPVTSKGGETRREDELILKQNTKYLFRITSGGADNVVGYRATWYEHTNKG